MAETLTSHPNRILKKFSSAFAAIAISTGAASCTLQAPAPSGVEKVTTAHAPEDYFSPHAETLQVTNKQVLIKLGKLAIKGRAPETGYSREQFGKGWAASGGCDTRDIILIRDMPDASVDAHCEVQRGTLHDPYTGTIIDFARGKNSSLVQVDHVVSLSNAWQTGAFQFSPTERKSLANDPLNLLAVQGAMNEAKGDGDAATWLPPNKSERCRYIARQVLVKEKFHLWVTPPEHDAMETILEACPSQPMTLQVGLK